MAWNEGSICHLETVGTMHYSINWKNVDHSGRARCNFRPQKEMQHMGWLTWRKGLVTLAGSRLYTSAAYTPKMIDQALACFDKVFDNVGLIPEKK